MRLRATTVSGDYVHGSFNLLPCAGERARAALYFSRIVGSKSFEGNLELSRWYLRAALSEFRSIFDLINADLKAKGLASEWKKSVHKESMESDPIVAVLRKVRDFAIHSGNIVGEARTFKVVSPGEPATVAADMPAIVIEGLDRATLKLARGKDELSEFDDETLHEFNKQASSWPADLLVHIAVYRTSEYLAAFLSPNAKNAS